jgi:hypothetical protein
MKLSLWKASYLAWILSIVVLLVIITLLAVLGENLISIGGIIAFLSLSTLLGGSVAGLILDICKRKKFLDSIITIVGKFVLLHDEVRNPLLLILWVKENEVWFQEMVKDLFKYLQSKNIQVYEKDIKKPVYIKFKDYGKVGYTDKRGTWVKCHGFQKKGYIEVEWSSKTELEVMRNLLKHEVAHFLIDIVKPYMSEKSHHDLMNF